MCIPPQQVLLSSTPLISNSLNVKESLGKADKQYKKSMIVNVFDRDKEIKLEDEKSQ